MTGQEDQTMMQDAPRSFQLTNNIFTTCAAIAVSTATLTLLISCNGQHATRRVSQPYLADTTGPTDPSPDTAKPNDDFDTIKQNLLGSDNNLSQENPVNDFSAALDDYLANPKAGKSNNNPDTLSNQPATQDQKLKPSNKTLATNITKPDLNKNQSKANPVVQWESPTRQPKSGNATPADRKENIGSARDSLNPNNSTATGSDTRPVKNAADSNPTDHSAIKEAAPADDDSPIDKIKSFSRDELLVLLSAKLRRDAAYSSVPLREYLLDAATLMLDPSRRVSPDDLYDLNDRERKLLSQMQGFFIEIGKQLETTRDPETIVDAVNKLARGLGSDDRLEIPSFKLCTSVQSFGNYDEVKSTSFVRGQAHEIITYIEVANFKPNATIDNRFKTVLTQESELYTDSDGTLIFKQPAVTANDFCRNIRNDFFLVRHLTLPANLSVGSYYLKVRVKDEITQQQAEAVIPITIVASL